jgi:hypothetical protein
MDSTIRTGPNWRALQERDVELGRLAELRGRVEQGIDRGEIDLLAGSEVLLRISEARVRLMEA